MTSVLRSGKLPTKVSHKIRQGLLYLRSSMMSTQLRCSWHAEPERSGRPTTSFRPRPGAQISSSSFSAQRKRRILKWRRQKEGPSILNPAQFFFTFLPGNVIQGFRAIDAGITYRSLEATPTSPPSPLAPSDSQVRRIEMSDDRQRERSDELLEKLIAKEILPQSQNWEGTEAFLQRIVEVLLKYIRDENDRDQKILEFHHPDQMQQLIDLSIPEKPQNLLSLVKSCEQVLRLGVRTGHPRFFNQISCGLDLVSMAGEWLTATANTNMFTYEIAPVFILMEKAVMKAMWEAIGWDVDKADGIFAPGGALANLYAMNAARHHLHPRSKHLGMKEIPTLCSFTSEDSHYSIKSAAAVCGIGTDHCFNIPTDMHGKMIPEALEQKIIECKKEGLTPFFVCCTAGSTVYGAFDPIEMIADICERHKLWFHVDAAWGGGLLLSPEHRYKLAGVERANSVTWNPHKLMGALLQCSACLFRQDGLLFQCNQMSADYLFQQDKPYDVSFDTGDKAIQCGRHNDVFKLWLMWKSKGVEGYRQQINRLMDLCHYFTQRIKETDGFELIIEKPEFLNICFWYVPKKLRSFDEFEKRARLEKIAPKIKAGMMQRGTTMVGYQPDKQRPNFFRMIISNQAITAADLDFLIKEIADIGESLE